MTNSTANVVAGKPLVTGGALCAPRGTALPTDTSTALNAAFLSTGYISKDGSSITPDRSGDKIKAWGGDTVLVTQTDFNVEVKLTLIEALNSTALKAAFGSGNVTVTAANSSHGAQTATAINSTPLDHQSWALEIRNGLKKIRVVVPDGQVTKVDEIKFTDSDAIGYSLTITAFPDSSGNHAYQYTDDGVTTA